MKTDLLTRLEARRKALARDACKLLEVTREDVLHVRHRWHVGAALHGERGHDVLRDGGPVLEPTATLRVVDRVEEVEPREEPVPGDGGKPRGDDALRILDSHDVFGGSVRRAERIGEVPHLVTRERAFLVPRERGAHLVKHLGLDFLVSDALLQALADEVLGLALELREHEGLEVLPHLASALCLVRTVVRRKLRQQMRAEVRLQVLREVLEVERSRPPLGVATPA